MTKPKKVTKRRKGQSASKAMLEVRTGYMCATDFEHELGRASDGNKVYPSVKALKKDRPCIAECGYVRVDVVMANKRVYF